MPGFGIWAEGRNAGPYRVLYTTYGTMECQGNALGQDKKIIWETNLKDFNAMTVQLIIWSQLDLYLPIFSEKNNAEPVEL